MPVKVQGDRPFDPANLRTHWYREGWYSERTCIDALMEAARLSPKASVTFADGDSAADETVGGIGSRAAAFAGALQALGVGSGDAVAVQLANRMECAIAYQAVLLCGGVLVPIIHIYGLAEIEYILRESAAKLVVISADADCGGNFESRVAGIREVNTVENIIALDTTPGVGYVTFDHLRFDREYTRPQVLSDDVCLLVYTSGTTSSPKGVQHTHNSLLAEHHTLPSMMAQKPGDVLLASFPPGHIAGVNNILRPMISGTPTVFMRKWNPADAVALIDQYGVTSTAGTPTHLQGLLDAKVRNGHLSSLREFLVGAAPVSEELGRRAAAEGIATFRCYGSTEHPTVTSGYRDHPKHKRLRTDGKPLPGSAVRIIDAGGFDATDRRGEGEVVVRGPDQFVGYRNANQNQEAFTADGWFRTGDLGWIDEQGFLTITDRIKDVIIRGGETISSGQVEEVLIRHPAVLECAVVAAPHPRYGEVVAAVVVLREDCSLTLDELRAYFAASGLAKQKTPERLSIVAALPRTELGKVKKAALRRELFP
jgi:acyl-CoA synthetase (AMP-forming)/AMP-acid ligase II